MNENDDPARRLAAFPSACFSTSKILNPDLDLAATRPSLQPLKSAASMFMLESARWLLDPRTR